MRPFIFIVHLALLPFLGNAQQVKWEETTFNFGTIGDWNSPPATFTFKNIGKDKLMFLPQRHDREVLVRYPNHSIRPGETGTISILYYTGETGPFSRTVDVYTNASDRPVKLTVKGNIKSIYADALTSCPSFHSTNQPITKGEPNVIQVVDARTDRPIPGAQVEIFDRGVRKTINGTNLEGVAVNWIEPGNYITVAYKEGYEKGEEEVSFTKRDRTHIIYLNRSSVDPIEPEVAVVDQQAEVSEIRYETSSDEELDLGISLNEQLESEDEVIETGEMEPVDLGISTDEQWEEADEGLDEEVNASTSLRTSLGISLNEQISEEPTTEPKGEPELGVTTNEILADEKPEDEPAQEVSVEAMVEAALADAEVENAEDTPPETEVRESEPEFSANRYKPNNVLLLLDVSGSMDDDGKMDKLKASIRRLVMMLREVDVLTMIAYNSSSWEVLSPTLVTQNEAIVALVDSLKPSGYTNGVKGMESAYQSLEQQLIAGGNNQLIIATDGKFNSSKFSEKEAIQLVKDNSDKGIVLSIIGFGDDREANRLMKRLSDLGGGSFLQVKTNEDPTELLADEIKLRSQKL
ncbi:MAG: DUF1573 domain-containing protein [Flavobacteriales bacterium]|nr:DUF1573 domain-containing protein [Flavobacteriales bacterium]